MNNYAKKIEAGPSPTYNAEELARLAKLCVGTTSTVVFSERAGLSRAFLSAILNGKLKGKPSKRSLRKMVASDAQPQNGVTEAQLLEAAGYDPASNVIEEPPTPSVKLNGSSFLDEVQEYCNADINGIRIAAQCITGELIQKINPARFTIEAASGWVTITEDRPNNESPLLHVCIPAFVSAENLMAQAFSAAVLRYGEARRKHKACDARFYIISNSRELCEFIAKALGVDEDVSMLLTTNFVDVSKVYPTDRE